MPNINIDDAYILGETGAQVDKVTGLFTKDEDTTSGEKAFAQLNIGTAGSNHNLLDNPFFTIRQRGDGPFTSAGNTLDRWKAVGNTTITGDAGGMRMEASTTYRGVSQFIETPAALANLTLTFSADITSLSGNIFVQIYDGAGAQILVKELSEGLSSVTFTAPANGIKEIYLSNRASTSVNVLFRAVKLEVGSVSTLANDAPPEYGTELLKCQYYAAPLEYTTYSNPFTGLASSATEFFVEAYLPRSMREISNPTISVTGTAYAIRNGSTGAITAWDAGAIKGNHIRLKGTTTNLTANTQVPVYTASNTLKIFVSADL